MLHLSFRVGRRATVVVLCSWRTQMRSTKRRFELFLVLCLALAQASCARAASQTTETTSDANDLQKVAPLLSVVRASGMSIWIEYHGTCAGDSVDGMALRLRVNPKLHEAGSDALASVRSMLDENENLSISASTPGIINVTTLNVWSPILDAKLGRLKLSSLDRYNADWAIEAAVRASEKSQRKLNARPWATWVSILGGGPSAGRPHLKKSASYATLNDLLIDVSRTFAGILVYKECALPDSSHLFDVFYYSASEVPP